MDAASAETASPHPARLVGERAPIPVEVRRQVWARDEGRCTYVSADGRRCESRWQLELDHIVPAALGGPPTIMNTRLRCRAHNGLHAEECFGREHMARFAGARRQGSRRVNSHPLAVVATSTGDVSGRTRRRGRARRD